VNAVAGGLVPRVESRRGRAWRALVLSAIVVGFCACAHEPFRPPPALLPPGALAAVDELSVAAGGPPEVPVVGALPDRSLATLGGGLGAALRHAVVDEARRAGLANVREELDPVAAEPAAAGGPAPQGMATSGRRAGDRQARVRVAVTEATFVSAPGPDAFQALQMSFSAAVELPPPATGESGPAPVEHPFTLVDLEPRAASGWAADGGRAVSDARDRLLARATRRIVSALSVGGNPRPGGGERAPPEAGSGAVAAPAASGDAAPGARAGAISIDVSSSYELVGGSAKGLGPGGGAVVGLVYGAGAGLQASVACLVLFPVCMVVFVPAGAAVGMVVGVLVGGIGAAVRSGSSEQGEHALAPDPVRSGLREALQRMSSDPALAARIGDAALRSASEAGAREIHVKAISARLSGLPGAEHPALPLLTVTGSSEGRGHRTVAVQALGPLAAHLFLEDDAVLLRAALGEAADRAGAELALAFEKVPPPPAAEDLPGGAIWQSGAGQTLQ
jgi:hypothetical protein